MNTSLEDDSPVRFFSPKEFGDACRPLAEAFRTAGVEARWAPFNNGGYLLIRQVLAIAEDEKAGNINVDYHILLSPTYQVPVVYFAPTWMDEEGTPLTLKEVYTFIVDVSSKEAIEDVGVMGGLSHGDHPLLGIPYYFIHPCRTADLLTDIWNEKTDISSEQHLQIWLGLVGGVIKIPAPKPNP